MNHYTEARLSVPELQEYRHVTAQCEALTSGAVHVPLETATEIFVRRFEVGARIAAEYDLGDEDNFSVSPVTGEIFVFEE